MIIINATKRDTELNPRQIREKGLVPATIYGKGMDSVSTQLDCKEFMIAYRKDKNAIFEIKIEKETYKALVKKVQSEAVSGKVLNVEFQRVLDDQKVRIIVPIETTGTSEAVKAGGMLVYNLSEVKVECLPTHIPSSVKLDIAKLANFGETVSIADIDFPEGVAPIGTTDVVAIKVKAPKATKK
jgi:large subunit ribosomal protein L25